MAAYIRTHHIKLKLNNYKGSGRQGTNDVHSMPLQLNLAGNLHTINQSVGLVDSVLTYKRCSNNYYINVLRRNLINKTETFHILLNHYNFY